MNGDRLTKACNSDKKRRLELLTDLYQFSQLGDDVKSIEFAVEISPELGKLQDKVFHGAIEKELGKS